MIFDNLLPFAKSGRPIRTLLLPFFDQRCAQTQMKQHIDFPMEISVLKFQAWPDEKLAFLGCFSKRSTHILAVTCLRLQFFQSDLIGSRFLKA